MIDCSNTSGTCTSGGSRPSEKDGGMGGWGGRALLIQILRKSNGGGGGASLQNFFSAFWATVWSKNKGGRQAPPQDLPLCTLHVHNSHG